MCVGQSAGATTDEIDLGYWERRIGAAAAAGERVLGFAVMKAGANLERLSFESLGSGLVFLGIVSFIDPPREEAIAAITDCRSAGIAVKMITSLNRSLRGWANYFRHGVSKATFNAVDSHAWLRLAGWIRRKHRLPSRKQLRRRFCDQRWRIAHNGVVFTGASSVTVTRYRYRGATHPDPLDPNHHHRSSNGQDTWRAGCGESRSSGSAGGHGFARSPCELRGFGGNPRVSEG